MFKSKIKQNQGFTLIETFVAVTILVFAILGPLQMFSQSIADSTYAKYQIIGFYLASEGLDTVVNKKDNNVRSGGADWLADLSPSGTQDVDPLAGVGATIFGNSECDSSAANHGCRIYMDVNGYYRPAFAVSSDSGKKVTPFYRQVKIEAGGGGEEKKVTSIVWWNYKGSWRGTTLTTYIANI